jgi:hypothetical protein
VLCTAVFLFFFSFLFFSIFFPFHFLARVPDACRHSFSFSILSFSILSFSFSARAPGARRAQHGLVQRPASEPAAAAANLPKSYRGISAPTEEPQWYDAQSRACATNFAERNSDTVCRRLTCDVRYAAQQPLHPLMHGRLQGAIKQANQGPSAS